MLLTNIYCFFLSGHFELEFPPPPQKKRKITFMQIFVRRIACIYLINDDYFKLNIKEVVSK